MYLIVGLGNPGMSYAQNRHNVGFQCVSFFAERHGLRFDQRRAKAQLADGTLGGQRVILARPQTFMNTIGESVAPLVQWYKLDPGRELLVIYDDLDLPEFSIRLRGSGSSGGHNGMKSIIQQLGTQNFARLRVGIGRPPGSWDVINYVLGNWSREQSKLLPELYAMAADALELYLREGISAAMNRYNNSSPLC